MIPQKLPDMKLHSGFMAAMLLFATACTLQKNIEINLPPYESKLVVECYLEPGKPYRLVLLETVPYNATTTLPIINNALVIVTHNGIADTLKNTFEADSSSNKLFNYTNPNTIPADYDSDFSLYVKDSKGRIATATTKLLRAVDIDSVKLNFGTTPATDTIASVLTYFSDNPAATNFYRFIINYDGVTGYTERDFVLSDNFASNGKIVVGTRQRFLVNETICISLYHIDKAHYDYAQSAVSAAQAAASPFGQPGNITSNVKGGGFGIFTSLAYSRKTLQIRR